MCKYMMAVKTITVTEDAYNALRSFKSEKESFSKTILKITRKKPLNTFFGVLGKKSGEKLEKAISELRKQHNKSHQIRLKDLTKAFSE